MKPKLELLREAKLHRLIAAPGVGKRLEASGVAVVDDHTAVVVFDNLHRVAHLDLSLERAASNRVLPAPSLGAGFEDVTIDRKTGHMFCLVEALEDWDGQFRGFVAEFEPDFRLISCTRLATIFEDVNKGFEGLVHVRFGDDEELLCALCETGRRLESGRVAGRVEAFARSPQGGWTHSHAIDLPESAEFEDYAGIDYRFGRIAVVSQESACVWVAGVDEQLRTVAPDSEAVYRFPKKGYCNVEGIAWLDAETLVAVSDKRKGSQRARCEDKDQSIHVFHVPGTQGANDEDG